MGQSFSGENDGQSTVRSTSKAVKGREAEYTDFFSYRLGPLVILLLYFILADFDSAVFYAPTPEECKDLAPPAARMLAKLDVPDFVHAGLVNSGDTVAIGMVLVGYLDRIGILEKIIPAFVTGGKKIEHEPIQRSPEEVPAANSNGAVPISLESVRGIGSQFAAD